MFIENMLNKCKRVVLRHKDIIYKYRYFDFLKDYNKFKKMSLSGSKRFKLTFSDRFPCLSDATSGTSFDKHYVYHTAWAARIVQKIKPEYHVDISSSLYFCSIVSAFVPVRFCDYRPAELSLSNLSSNHANLTDLFFKSDSVHSLSCMHTIEHIGLGRYGDSIDPDGDLKAISELKRVLAPQGNLLIVVPIGGEAKIMFNAHRIYSYSQIMEYFNDLDFIEFALIPDFTPSPGIIYNATEELANRCTYGCGCFWFKNPVILQISENKNG